MCKAQGQTSEKASSGVCCMIDVPSELPEGKQRQPELGSLGTLPWGFGTPRTFQEISSSLSLVKGCRMKWFWVSGSPNACQQM